MNPEGGHDSIPSNPSQGEGIWKELNLRVLTPSDLLANRKSRKRRWLWEPYLLDGGRVALLVGLPKSGKTTFAYELALAVAKGTPFLGTPTRQGGVLIIAVEEHLDDVAARLRTLGMSKTDPIGVIVPPIADSPETFRKLRDEIKKRRARLVILDSLSTFWSVDNESASAQVNRWFRQIVDVAPETGATWLIIHHERKAGGSGGVEENRLGAGKREHFRQPLLLPTTGGNYTHARTTLMSLISGRRHAIRPFLQHARCP